MYSKTILNEILKTKEFKKDERIKQFSVEIYKKSDFKELMNLYEKVFPHYKSKELWSWKNEQNPFGKYYTFLMKDKELIIGAYSVAPREFSIYGKQCSCVQSLDTMTDQNYCGRGISTFLANLTYEYARLNGKRFVYGFPNNSSIYMFEKKLDWINCGQITLFIKGLTQITTPSINDISFYIREVKFFTQEIDEFWDMQKKFHPLIIEKNMNYLNWRYINHPFVKYGKFLVFDKKTDEIIAYFILKKYKDKIGNITGHIVDLMINQTEKSKKLAIFKIIESYACSLFKKKCCKITLWMPDTELATYLINKLGYKKIKIETYFGFRTFNNESKQLSLLFEFDNWKIMMSDNDVF